MSIQGMIDKILLKNPQLSEFQVLEKLQAERVRTGGLLDDETLVRLIAARYGVEVEQKLIHCDGNLATGRLFVGLNDVTVAGRLIAVFPIRTFEGEKAGKFATLMIADNDGILRVVLWNDKADVVGRGDLKVGQTIRLLHGYTRVDRYGKVELHLGGKGQIEMDASEKGCEYPNLERFSTKINAIKSAVGGAVHLSGVVKQVLGSSTFVRGDSSDGMVMRLILIDDSGEVAVVIWNEKVAELEVARVNSRLQLVNAKVWLFYWL